MTQDTKPKLSDVIGGLVASVAHARAVADVEALRIAYRYRQNEFLKGLPVPRLRLRNVSISLPVVVTDVVPGVTAVANDPSEIAQAATSALEKAFKKVTEDVKNFLKRDDITDEERQLYKRYERLLKSTNQVTFIKNFRDALNVRLKDALLDLNDTDGGTPTSDPSIREVLADEAEVIFREHMKDITTDYVYQRGVQSGEPEKFDPHQARKWYEDEVIKSDFVVDLISSIRVEIRRKAIKTKTISPDFYVSVDTDSIKNTGGGPDAVTRLSMILREEGLEWVAEVRGDGTETTKLMPE